MLNEDEELKEAQRILDESKQLNYLQYYFQKLEYGFGSAPASDHPPQGDPWTPEPDDPSETDTDPP